MSNIKDELAWHGSKLCMQICVNNEHEKKFLEQALGLGTIKWYSPLVQDDFREYLLGDFAKAFPNISIPDNVISDLKILRSQWDAIGQTEDGTLILVEAKAHTDEMEQSSHAINPESKNKIKRLLADVVGNDDVWIDKYYQLANRLTYLSYLIDSGVKVKLVYLCFVDDVSFMPEKYETWKSYVDNVDAKLQLKPEISSNYIHIYLDIWKNIKY